MASTPTKRGAGDAMRRYGAGRIAFLKHREAITQAIEAGQPLRACFASFEAKLAISYSQFGRHVATFIRPPKRRNINGRIDHVAQAPGKAGQPIRAVVSTPVRGGANPPAGNGDKRAGNAAGIPGFTYRPADAGDTNDLI